MPAVMTRCPNTNAAIGVGPVLTREEFDSLTLQPTKVSCTSCGKVHTITQENVYLGKK